VGEVPGGRQRPLGFLRFINLDITGTKKVNSYQRLAEHYSDENRKRYFKRLEARFLEANGYPRCMNDFRYDASKDYPQHRVEIVGKVARVRSIWVAPYPSKGARGKVTTLSFQSRRRLYEFLLSIDWDAIEDDRIRVVTLTYHENYPKDGKGVKRHLHNFRREIMRDYPGSILIWKLEYQARGAPHFHLIWITPTPQPLGNYQIVNSKGVVFYDRVAKRALESGHTGLRSDIQEKWNRITGEDWDNFNAGTEVDEVKKKGAIAAYLCKYMAKQGRWNGKGYQTTPPKWFSECGRWWGCYGRGRVGIQKMRYHIDAEIVAELFAQARAYWVANGLREYESASWGFNLYTKSIDDMDATVLRPIRARTSRDAAREW
jgi:hypothetical protein